MSFPLNPSNGQQAIVNGIKYNYSLSTNSWRRDFNNVLDRLFLVGNNEAINTSTGDLVVSGGGTFGKSLVVGGRLTVSGSVSFDSTVSGIISTATTAISVRDGSTGSLIYQSAPSTSAFIPIASTGTILMSNGVIPIWTSTAAITSAFAITATNVLGGGQWQIAFQTSPNFTSFSPNFTYDTQRLTISNITTSTSPTTGALVVSGGVGVGGDLFVAGNFQVNGNTTFVNSTNLEVLDRNITLSKGSPDAISSDMAGITVEGPGVQPTILYRAFNDSWTLNKLLVTPSVQVTNLTASSSTSTGALIVSGGLGVGGQLFATSFNGPLTGTVGAGVKNTGAFTSVSIVNTTPATSTSTGALTVAGGMSIAGDFYAGGHIIGNEFKVGAVTSSTDIFTGALIVDGGAGIQGDVYVGGTIYGTATNTLLANLATLSLNATTSTNIANGIANQIPYQRGIGQTAFSPFLAFNGSILETIRINLTTSSNSILPGAVYGVDLTNSGINQSPAIRLRGSSSGIVLVSSFGTLRVMQDATTLTNSLMTIGLTSVGIPTITSSINTQTGSLVVGGGVGIGGALFVGEQLNALAGAVVTGPLSSTYNVQPVSTLTNASGVVVHNITNSEVFYHSSITNNFTANFTNVPTVENREYNFRLILAQGVSGFYASGIQINGSVQTLRWSSAPSAGSNRIEVQNIRVIRVNGAWLVMSTLTPFF